MDLDAKTFVSVELIILILVVIVFLNFPYNVPYVINLLIVVTLISAYIIHYYRLLKGLKDFNFKNNVMVIVPYLILTLLLFTIDKRYTIFVFIALGLYQYYTYCLFSKIKNKDIDMSKYYIVMLPITSIVTYYGFKNNIFLLKFFMIDNVFHILRFVFEHII